MVPWGCVICVRHFWEKGGINLGWHHKERKLYGGKIILKGGF